MTHTVRIWDLPTRIFHWLLACSVVGLVVTANVGGNAMVWHFRLGYTVLTLLLFRVVWGFIGGRWSRFSAFLYAPGTVIRYLRGRASADHKVGHNPLGALSVLGLLLFLFVQVGTGLLSDDEIAFAGPLTALVSGDTVANATWYHKDIGAWILIAMVSLHVLAILFYTLGKKQTLVRPMLHGDKQVPLPPVQASRDDAASRSVALFVLLVCAAAVRWLVQLGG